MNKLIKRIKLISEGKTLVDKIKICAYILSLGKYSPEIYLKNEDGEFFIRANSADLWMLSPLGEIKIRDYFKLKSGIFLDVGANVGKYSVIIGNQLRENGKVFAFEPEPSNLKALKRNLELNRLTNVNIIPLACSDKKDRLKLYLNEKNSGGHSLIEKQTSFIEVDVDTLDNRIEKQKIKKVDMIKIDVEGAEADVLKGAKKILKRYHPRVIFEAWDEEHLNRIEKVLIPFKYQIKKIGEENYLAY